MRLTAALITPPPISVIVFGSFARGDADAHSDLDVIVVRSGDVDEEDVAWRSALETWRQTARRLTGNRVEVIEVGEQEVGRLLQSGRPLWTDVQADGVALFGAGLAELTARHIAQAARTAGRPSFALRSLQTLRSLQPLRPLYPLEPLQTLWPIPWRP